MEILKDLIPSTNIFLLLLLFFYIIRYINNIKSILPSRERKLEELKKLKQHTVYQLDDITNEILTDRIRDLDFRRINGFSYSQKNIELLQLYSKIKDKITLRDFRRISSHIKNTQSLDKIGNKKVLKSYKIIFIKCIALITLIIISIFTIILRKPILSDIKFFEDLILMFFFYTIVSIYFFYMKDTLKVIKKYDNIIEKLKKQ